MIMMMMMMIYNNNNDNNNNSFSLKGTIQDFYNLLTSMQTVSSMYTQVARAHLSHATCCVPQITIEGTAQLLSLTEFKSHFC